jgi:serine/threonine protein phosphatase PrpC
LKIQKSGLAILSAAVSDRGRVRSENQDAYLIAPEKGLFIISDGMGGHQAGATAAQFVIQMLPKLLENNLGTDGDLTHDEIAAALGESAVTLSDRLREEGLKDPSAYGLGATIVMILIRDRFAHIMNLGDSRAYLLRGGHFSNLTDDHTIVGALLRMGEITQEEAHSHPKANQISRYVGMEGEAHPGIKTQAINPGDRLLLCSDGLTGLVGDAHIERLLAQEGDPQKTCHALVDTANEAGGHDNVSVIVVDILSIPRRDV